MDDVANDLPILAGQRLMQVNPGPVCRSRCDASQNRQRQVENRCLAAAGRRVTLAIRNCQGGPALPRRTVLVGSAVIAVLGALSPAQAADEVRCRELARQFQGTRAQITAIEVSLTLFAAADANCVALATELLDFGASVDARDRLGARPLSHAARFGHLEMVDLLLARGAPIDARNLAGATALYQAAERGHTAVAQRLIDRGADVRLTGRSDITPIAAAAYAGNDAIVEMLLAHGADERLPDATGKPPVVYAAAAGRLDVVKRLLARNIDVNARYANDLTLLMWAAGADEKVADADAVRIVAYLLEGGAHIDDRDARGRTALMIAAEGGRTEVATVLLAHGADPSLRDKAGKRAADLTVLTSLRERLSAH
jgi:ankyrin repeat protein